MPLAVIIAVKAQTIENVAELNLVMGLFIIALTVNSQPVGVQEDRYLVK
jgi:hypothetical protein